MQPFNLSDHPGFESWAEHKLSLYSQDRLRGFMEPVTIAHDGQLSADNLSLLIERIKGYNFCLYSVPDHQRFNSDSIRQLSQQIGLQALDANLCASEDLISIITDTSDSQENSDKRKRYIPYSTKALSWHTDGYYNPFHQRVQAFVLHCQQTASAGGENGFIDPEIIYLQLRRENPVFIEALCADDVMRIPQNIQDGICIRPETASSVFQISDDFSVLAMRYSQRKRHIIWRDDPITQQALECLQGLLNEDAIWRINYRLQNGQGVICNNVLHRRNAYEDDPGQHRVYIRARYYNRIRSTVN